MLRAIAELAVRLVRMSRSPDPGPVMVVVLPVVVLPVPSVPPVRFVLQILVVSVLPVPVKLLVLFGLSTHNADCATLRTRNFSH